MSFYKRIQALGLDDETNVNLVLEEGCDVHHYTDDYLSNAMAITGIAHTLAEVITEGPLYKTGSDILQEMRDEGLLDDYERGSEDFTSFVAEVIEDNHWDLDSASECCKAEVSLDDDEPKCLVCGEEAETISINVANIKPAKIKVNEN